MMQRTTEGPRNRITITLAAVRRMPTVWAPAIRCGFFAVHVPSGDPLDTHPPNGWYAITHIATGYLAGCVEGLDKAVAVARAFSKALGGQDFTLADFEGKWTDRYRAFVEQAKAIALKHGVGR